MTSSSTTSRQLTAIGGLDADLTDRGIDHWVFGGWAVDLHLGRTSREHADVDLAIWASDRVAVQSLLLEQGWVHVPDADEDGWTAYERSPVRLEVAFLARADDGTVYTPLAHGRGSWPAASFGDQVGEIDGVRSRVVGLASLVEDKSAPRTDPTTAAKDRADVALLTGDVRPCP